MALLEKIEKEHSAQKRERIERKDKEFSPNETLIKAAPVSAGLSSTSLSLSLSLDLTTDDSS